MPIIHVITSIDKSIGGPARSVSNLLIALLEQTPILVILNCLSSADPIISKFSRNNGRLIFNKVIFKTYSSELKQSLIFDNTVLFHGHGLWQMPVHQMAKRARKSKRPYIISPRGMLDTWSLNHKSFKKKIALFLFQNKDIKNANVLHATSLMEASNIRALGYNNPIAIIPNGISIIRYNYDKRETIKDKKILFLSRIVRNKGVEELIEAWNYIDKELKHNWKIEIVGNGEENYLKKIRNIIKSKKLGQEIIITGAIFGNNKIKKYQEADLFVLPSYSENFGIVVAEALACGIPVITTKGAPWQELQTHNCGDWIDIGVTPLVIALNTMMSKPPEELLQMGANGRRLIEEKYSMEAVAKQMLELYHWIIYKTEKPDFVDII